MKFYIIGIDDNSQPQFRAEVESIVYSGKVFSGGVRHHQIVEDLLPSGVEWIDITPPMDRLIERYRAHDEVVVFASGDPLFYGFAQTIQRLMPDAEIVTYPYFNSLQQLAHALTMPYQDMHVVSLTGRAWHKFDAALIQGYEMIGVLTDNRDHTPRKIAQRMVDYGYRNYQISVGELLGNSEKERVRTMSVEQVAECDFAYPNNLILKRILPRKRYFGIPDTEFKLLDGREKMITKRMIRLATLAQLNLTESQNFWDVGFCTGSISIEAKMQHPDLHITAFEIREKCDQIIEENMRHLGTPGIDYRMGDFLSTELDDLASPDSVFIGGHGGRLHDIMERIVPRLSDGGVIVMNSVSKASYDLFHAAATSQSLTIEPETTISLDSFNQIIILKATKKI
ncbi:MAG: precorrin-6y C5,15-methyltransferase (decarboxylating) subunit CbiE [Rikenellaceae bacterium]